MIGNAKEHGGLYYFEDGQSLSTFVANSFFGFHSNCQDIILWHFWLGHPCFHYLRKSFPTLFVDKDPSSLHCEFVCWLSIIVHLILLNLINLQKLFILFIVTFGVHLGFPHCLENMVYYIY